MFLHIDMRARRVSPFPPGLRDRVRAGILFAIYLLYAGTECGVHAGHAIATEVVPNAKLVFTWAWRSTPERESLVTVEFKPSGQGTELIIIRPGVDSTRRTIGLPSASTVT